MDIMINMINIKTNVHFYSLNRKIDMNASFGLGSGSNLGAAPIMRG